MDHIFHPTDFSEASYVAFVHALKIALLSKSKLSMLHVADNAFVEMDDFPAVRETLERWKVLPRDSTKQAVLSLGLNIHKAIVGASDPITACVDYLATHPADLTVLATHQREGRMMWLGRSISEPIARQSKQTTLFIPHGVEGFVSEQDGTLHLSRMLIPVARNPRPAPSVDAALQLVQALNLPEGHGTLLHVGERGDMPAVRIPEEGNWTWERTAESGNTVDTILHKADQINADLIVMSTKGHHGFLDGLRGTVTERVLHRAKCPVLIVPSVQI